ncbi:Hypothetical predicted protein [Lecanosticta acicola]|uniref:Methyltransferase domain-containing protein n=1 Tax=Lecanosticta acicola TaxID=111012 RepID=A0AAI8VVK2_9PEZI|nr:Hypothetical predicted protein [Lecanosticta acicola]
MLRVFMNDQQIHTPLDPDSVRHVVDIGCGTGVVTDRLAAMFPKAEVLGLDMSPVPKLRECPGNVRYLSGNILSQGPSEWVTEEGNAVLQESADIFDLTFSRFLILGMRDWSGYIHKLYQLLKPGGWAEVQEIAPRLYDANGQDLRGKLEWHNWHQRYWKSKGLDLILVEQVPEIMKEAGFVDVQVKKYRLSVGGEGEQDPKRKKAGDFWRQDLLEVFTLAFSRAAKDSGDEAAGRMLDQFRQETTTVQGRYHEVLVFYGRKPN